MKRILIVEDNDINYFLVKEILSDYNVELVRAADGKEFYSKISRYADINLILMDMMLPDTDGIALTKYLIREKYQVPIIFMSASIERCKEIFDLGIKSFIPKPFSEEYFISIINQYIELERVKEYAYL
jgi:CheY-like chemotaxis protein